MCSSSALGCIPVSSVILDTAIASWISTFIDPKMSRGHRHDRVHTQVSHELRETTSMKDPKSRACPVLHAFGLHLFLVRLLRRSWNSEVWTRTTSLPATSAMLRAACTRKRPNCTRGFESCLSHKASCSACPPSSAKRTLITVCMKLRSASRVQNWHGSSFDPLLSELTEDILWSSWLDNNIKPRVFELRNRALVVNVSHDSLCLRTPNFQARNGCKSNARRATASRRIFHRHWHAAH